MATDSDFVLDAPGLKIEEAQQSLIWRGKSRSSAFLVKVPADFSDADANLRVRVLRHAVPIGLIRFSIEVISEGLHDAMAPAGDFGKPVQTRVSVLLFF